MGDMSTKKNGGTLFIAIDGRGDLLRGQVAQMGSLQYEKRRGERIEKPRVESKRYYTPPSIESDFDCCKQGEGRLTSQ